MVKIVKPKFNVNKIPLAIIAGLVLLGVTVWVIRGYDYKQTEPYYIYNYYIGPKNNPDLYLDIPISTRMFIVQNTPVINLTKDAKSNLEKSRIVQNWIQQELHFGTPENLNTYFREPVPILINNKQGYHVLCDGYSVVLASMLRSVNVPSRTVHLLTKDGHGHYLNEIWSPENNKWVLVDSELNNYYSINGKPLSAAQLYFYTKILYLKNKIQIVGEPILIQDPLMTYVKDRLFDYFNRFEVIPI